MLMEEVLKREGGEEFLGSDPTRLEPEVLLSSLTSYHTYSFSLLIIILLLTDLDFSEGKRRVVEGNKNDPSQSRSSLEGC